MGTLLDQDEQALVQASLGEQESAGQSQLASLQFSQTGPQDRLNTIPDPAAKTVTSTPLLKWPGGKRALVRQLVPLLPKRFGRYFEPFVGGGALFFTIQSTSAVLADRNGELMECYRQVRDNPNGVISHLAEMRNTREEYYAIRSLMPSDNAQIAARLIYLTTLSFNGIHRVNLNGQFNVPYGHKTHLHPCDPSKILAISTILASADLICCDFEEAVASATAGDVIYFNPPYTVAHGSNGFVKYNARIFSWSDQRRLADLAEALDRRGCRVIVSNADHPSVHELYSRFEALTIHRPSRISASPQYRRRVTECVFHNGR